MLNSFYTLNSGTDAPSLHAKCDNPSVSDFNFMQQEKWHGASIKPDYYEISTLGNVRSFVQYHGRRLPITRRVVPKLIKPCRDGRGYYNFTVSLNGKPKTLLIHIEMAKAFIPNPHNYKLVRHINDIKSDNRIENLSWGTHSHNMEDSIKNGKHFHHTGNVRSKLSKENVLYIINSKETNCELGRKFSVSESTISKIRLGRNHIHITKIKYK